MATVSAQKRKKKNQAVSVMQMFVSRKQKDQYIALRAEREWNF